MFQERRFFTKLSPCFHWHIQMYLIDHFRIYIGLLSLVWSQWMPHLGICTLSLLSAISYPIFVILIGTNVSWFHCSNLMVGLLSLFGISIALSLTLALTLFLRHEPITVFKIQFISLHLRILPELNSATDLLLYVVFLKFYTDCKCFHFWHFFSVSYRFYFLPT